MKTVIYLFVSVLLLFAVYAAGKIPSENNKNSEQQKLTVFSSPDLKGLAEQWANSFCETNSGKRVDVVVIRAGMSDEWLESGESIGFVPESFTRQAELNSAWKIVAGRDVIVPVVNSKNPLLGKLDAHGLTPDTFAMLMSEPGKFSWGSLLKENENNRVNFYLINDEMITEDISRFTGIDPALIHGITISKGKELVRQIQNDPYGIGFCRLADIIDMKSHGFVDNISLVPIDKNGNGRIDYFESIYVNPGELSRGIWIGKYPKALIRNLYIVASGIPENETGKAFLKWVLTEGQADLESYGYNELVVSERTSKLEALNEQVVYTEKPVRSYAALKFLIPALILVIIIGGFIISYYFRKRKNHIDSGEKIPLGRSGVINENSMELPNGLYFDKTHTWVFMEVDGVVKVGIDDFIQHITGPYTRINMKNPGEQVKRDDILFTLIQNGKHLNIHAPVSGTILDINEDLVTEPALVNDDPYSKGWIYLLEPSNWLREIQFLRMAGRYREWLKHEIYRLKDFLAKSANNQTLEPAFVAFQEGGELNDHILEEHGPEIWEEFQKQFIDTSELR